MSRVIIDISHEAPVRLTIVAGVQYVIIRSDDVPNATPNLKGLSLLFSIKYMIGTRKTHDRGNRSKFRNGIENKAIELASNKKVFIKYYYISFST
jgi:hypothetical protein